ncbi:MAG: thiamine-phosphate kinase [Armatimonadota bacterium]|nr:thiamine-phosphate kinase [Armatimonadota bacterium]
MKISKFGGEDALIRLIRDSYSAAPNAELTLSVGDDAALIDIGGKLLVVTTDLLIENTHFRMDINEPYLLGWKSAAVNISDVAAMGGEPTYSFVSIGLPDIDVETVKKIYEGLADANAAFGSAVAGGDTALCEEGIVINVTQLGVVEPELAARRSGAKAGDAIIVTNTLGDSLAGLQLLLKLGLEQARRASAYCVEKHLKPEPRVAEARAAVRTGKVHAMMDISDGLAADLPRLCAASNVGARVWAQAMPLSSDLYIAAARLDAEPVELAAAGGEDYELLITCSREDAAVVIQAIETAGSRASIIGETTTDPKVRLVMPDGTETNLPKGWEHFQTGAQP